MLSAHADADEILDWLRSFRSAARTTFVTHGEPTASDALRQRIEEELGWLRGARVPATSGDSHDAAHGRDQTWRTRARPDRAGTSACARGLGIDTQQEHVVYHARRLPGVPVGRLRSPLARALQPRTESRASPRSTVIRPNLLGPDEAGLSEAAWTTLGVVTGEEIAVTPSATARVARQRPRQGLRTATRRSRIRRDHRRCRRRPLLRHPSRRRSSPPARHGRSISAR